MYLYFMYSWAVCLQHNIHSSRLYLSRLIWGKICNKLKLYKWLKPKLSSEIQTGRWKFETLVGPTELSWKCKRFPTDVTWLHQQQPTETLDLISGTWIRASLYWLWAERATMGRFSPLMWLCSLSEHRRTPLTRLFFICNQTNWATREVSRSNVTEPRSDRSTIKLNLF